MTRLNINGKAVTWIHVRNEEAGAFAAAAEAYLTGRLAVCAGSCGPGNTHRIQGLYDTHRSGLPVLAIASHVPTKAAMGFATSFGLTRTTGAASEGPCR